VLVSEEQGVWCVWGLWEGFVWGLLGEKSAQYARQKRKTWGRNGRVLTAAEKVLGADQKGGRSRNGRGPMGWTGKSKPYREFRKNPSRGFLPGEKRRGGSS